MWISYLSYAPINNHWTRIPGNISNSHDKDISPEDWGRVYSCPRCWPLISRSRVSCFLYICVIQTSHTSCQHPRCHAVVCPIRGLYVTPSANKRSVNIEPMVGDNKAFLQILFPSLWQPGMGQTRWHCLDWNQRDSRMHCSLLGKYETRSKCLNGLCEFKAQSQPAVLWPGE